VVASWSRLPAIALLLPAEFITEVVTDDVQPALFGATFQPIVSLGVGFILFEAACGCGSKRCRVGRTTSYGA
jgi:hypothetical protein